MSRRKHSVKQIIGKLREAEVQRMPAMHTDGYVSFQMAEVAVPTNLFRKILPLIDAPRPRLNAA